MNATLDMLKARIAEMLQDYSCSWEEISAVEREYSELLTASWAAEKGDEP